MVYVKTLNGNWREEKLVIRTWNCLTLERRHLLAATVSTRMIWMAEVRARWRAPMSRSANKNNRLTKYSDYCID